MKLFILICMNYRQFNSYQRIFCSNILSRVVSDDEPFTWSISYYNRKVIHIGIRVIVNIWNVTKLNSFVGKLLYCIISKINYFTMLRRRNYGDEQFWILQRDGKKANRYNISWDLAYLILKIDGKKEIHTVESRSKMSISNSVIVFWEPSSKNNGYSLTNGSALEENDILIWNDWRIWNIKKLH